MDFPLLLLVLLALPVVVAAVIIGLSSVRRRRRTAVDGQSQEPVHRGQADSAAVQSAAGHPEPSAPKGPTGRERRAGSAATPPSTDTPDD